MSLFLVARRLCLLSPGAGSSEGSSESSADECEKRVLCSEGTVWVPDLSCLVAELGMARCEKHICMLMSAGARRFACCRRYFNAVMDSKMRGFVGIGFLASNHPC